MAIRDDIEELLHDSIELLRENLKRIRDQLAVSSGIDVIASNEAARLARSLAALSAEQRKAEKKSEADADETSQEGRIEIAERWLAQLAPEMLAPVVARLAASLKRRQHAVEVGGPAKVGLRQPARQKGARVGRRHPEGQAITRAREAEEEEMSEP